MKEEGELGTVWLYINSLEGVTDRRLSVFLPEAFLILEWPRAISAKTLSRSHMLPQYKIGVLCLWLWGKSWAQDVFLPTTAQTGGDRPFWDNLWVMVRSKLQHRACLCTSEHALNITSCQQRGAEVEVVLWNTFCTDVYIFHLLWAWERVRFLNGFADHKRWQHVIGEEFLYVFFYYFEASTVLKTALL